jgi:bacillithiol biosynthesis deacetylase BshB1
MSVDVVAIGAHPDDVEMTIGGTLAKLIDRGKRVAIVDLTRGEMASNGTPEERAEEADAAAKVLGIETRLNLDMGDGQLASTFENRVRLIETLRELRPRIVFAQYWDDLHPDHSAAGRMVHEIMYPIGFRNFPAAGEPFRPNEFLYYMAHFPFEPSFIVDVSESHEKKLESVRCYASQLNLSERERDHEKAPTLISRPGFLNRLAGRAEYFGGLIHREYGEPLLAPRAVPMDDPVEHYRPFFGM